MKTVCIRRRIKFQDLRKREVIGQFNGGSVSSDGGSLLLGEVEKRTRIIEKFSECFDDYRDEKRIEYTVNAKVLYFIAPQPASFFCFLLLRNLGGMDQRSGMQRSSAGH
jgi:Transposase DDE domain group 1